MVPSTSFLPFDPLARRIAGLIAVGAWGALAVAAWAQHVWHMEPCAWCVVQRVLTLLIAVLALIGVAGVARWRRGGRAGWAISLAALAILGLIAAWYQQTVAAQTLSCAWTWADWTLMASHLPELWPAFLEPRANCAQASKDRLLGLPWALWSGAGFALTLALAGGVGLRTLRRPR